MNHTITKKLVAYAKDTKAALSLEELTGIRDRMTVRKGQRNKQHAWSFRQLRMFSPIRPNVWAFLSCVWTPQHEQDM